MPIDPNTQATSLLTHPQEISPIEQQNRFGARHQVISGVTPTKFLTILAIQTPNSFSVDQFFEILNWLQTTHAVESMQTVFSADVPDFGVGYRCDLHLSAHLRGTARE